MPFKPMGHANPSGDLVTGTEIFKYLEDQRHMIALASKIRCRWIYYRPLTYLQLLLERFNILRHLRNNRPDLWFSYHSYYKAPDLLGSVCARKLNIPYVIFQGIYSTKRRKKLKTLPGFLLNRKVLSSATHIFTNKKRDYLNLQRLIEPENLTYIAPGIHPKQFQFSGEWREEIRQKYHINNEIVVMTAAMMRPGVKTEGILKVLESCSELVRDGMNIHLLVAGDGSNRQSLEKKGADLLGNRITFTGKIPRQDMYHYYSAADIFAFPGIDESLGMVYLEAQSCNLPVIAFKDWGGGEAVIHERTGLLSPAADVAMFTSNMAILIREKNLREKLGRSAGGHILLHHDLKKNYEQMEIKLNELANSAKRPL